MTSTLALTVTWDPTIRGILVVLVSFVILCGSAYLLLSTNVGSRVGFLVALAGLTGWMAIMGIAWWVYGIGLVGPSPTWQVREVVTTPTADDLSAAVLNEASDLSDWNELPEGDVKRGEAQASATEALTGEESSVKVFESDQDYVVIDAFDKGGKDPDAFSSNFPLPHPPHFAIIQVQAVEAVEVPFGETPPPAEPDPSAAVVSVVMERDLGSERLPSALFSIANLVVFGVTCNVLHRRDAAAAVARSEADA